MSDDKPNGGYTVKRVKRSELLAQAAGIQIHEPNRDQLAAAEMANATEFVNETLMLGQKKFAELGLGVSATVLLWGDQQTGEEDYLRFGKDGKEWKLSVMSGVIGDPPWERTESSLMSSSRELRAQALTRLPELYEALITRAQEAAKELYERAQSAHEFLSTLGDK